jgi:segregation and condensation protein B
MSQIEQHIQSIIFSSPNPVSILDLKLAVQKTLEVEIDEAQITASIEDIYSRFATDNFAFELVNSGGGYQFLSKSAYFKTINHFLNIQQKKKLSKPSLETLSIIAYNNGITKGEIEQIRGVASDYSVEKLLEKELIEIGGKKDSPGHPILYKVTQNFLDYFGINSIEELPKLKDLHIPEENAVGELNS